MTLLRKIVFIVLPIIALVVAPVSVASNKNKKEHEHHGDSKEKHHWHKEKEHGFYGGPPPWAPAYGYRRGHGDDDDHYVAMPVNVQTGNCNRELIGQILGGATGGYVGSQIGDGTGRLIAVATGTLVGVIIGGEIGRSMDHADKLCVDQALETAPDGTKIHWNDDSDRQYSVTPKNTYQSADGQYCREYQMESEIGGRTQQVYGKACRQADGAWKIVS